ncbi:hypothetical protein PFISCL1PPCAC_4256, partial [Pristionchus fissidentatus]
AYFYEARMPVDITTIREGGGTNFPTTGSRVECHYVLSLEDGKKIDSSRDREKTYKFNLGKGELIKGWEQGIPQMSTGQRAMMKVSSDLAYGPTGIPKVIPPNASLVFDVELI